MVPESSQVGEVSLYKCVNSPLKWRMKEVLLKNVSAVDKMIIKIDDILVVTYKYVIPNIDVAKLSFLISIFKEKISSAFCKSDFAK